MFSRRLKHIIAQVFLFAFILIKVSGLHALAHNNHNFTDVEHCVLCHIASRDNLTPLLVTDNSVHFESIEFQIFPKVLNHYEYLCSTKLNIGELYNKPPPIYTVY